MLNLVLFFFDLRALTGQLTLKFGKFLDDGLINLINLVHIDLQLAFHVYQVIIIFRNSNQQFNAQILIEFRRKIVLIQNFVKVSNCTLITTKVSMHIF
jgi:hypothetical protein